MVKNPYESPKTETSSPHTLVTQGDPELGALFTLLLMFQMVVGGLVAPDGGAWPSYKFFMFFALDVFLAFRLFLIYKIRRRPIPAVSGLVKFAILTSPVYMAIAGTYLMG